MPTLDELKDTLKELPVGDRLKLADWLYESADAEPEWLDEWCAVAEARIKDVEEGRVEGIPAEEVFRQMAENRRQK